MNNLKSKDGRKRHLETGQQHRYLDSHYYNINITLDWVKKKKYHLWLAKGCLKQH